MEGVLKFSGGVRHDPAVDAWFDARPGDLGDIARRWFQQLRACGADVQELVHDGCPTVCVADAPFAYTNVFRSHVNVGFFHGNALPDPGRLLTGAGRYMRHVQLRPAVAVDESALRSLIQAAYADIRERLRE